MYLRAQCNLMTISQSQFHFIETKYDFALFETSYYSSFFLMKCDAHYFKEIRINVQYDAKKMTTEAKANEKNNIALNSTTILIYTRPQTINTY